MMPKKALWKLKSTLASAAGYLGGYAVARSLTGDTPRVLMYHRFAAKNSSKALGIDEFEFQVRHIRRYFRPKTLNALVAELRSGRRVEKGTVVITVDDGYEDFYRYAFPILQHYQVPATVFLTTDFIDERMWLWPDILEFALSHAQSSEVVLDLATGPVRLQIDPAESRGFAWQSLVRLSLSVPDKEMRSIHAQLLERCNVLLPERPVEEYRPLSWKQVREMDCSGIEIGGHTRTHPALSRVSAEDLNEEIIGCKRRIEEVLGHRIDSFCYPNGTREDYNDEVKAVIQRAGFEAATVSYFDSQVTADLYELRRYSVDSWRRKFLQMVHGVELLTARRRRGIGRGKGAVNARAVRSES